MAKIDQPPATYENVLTSQYRVKAIQTSSFVKGCPASNIFTSDDKQMWMTDPGIPQSVCIDLGLNFQNDVGHTFNRNYTYFGFRCSHVYSSNPAKLQLNISLDGINFQTWALISQIAFKQGN